MPGYTTRLLTVRLGGRNYRIRALSDLQQFADPTGQAQRAGISSSLWSLFGQVWPSGKVLAEAMSNFDVEGKRILELGCGLGLSSLVLADRGADVVASDHHPLAESFLAYNAGLNDLPAVTYRDLPWAVPDETLGRFDLIIGSDILYERDHATQIAAMMQRHAQPAAELLITDPGRGNSGPFTRAMALQGYEVTEQRSRFDEKDTEPFRGRLLSYRRGSPNGSAVSLPE
ncbi:class I SAM-dependent methyltransferase [Pseudoxanthomonas putridarboris]|uniref:Calmodulin-lysine N-methyltransferase n=1 Tax=Pseudoxanthomonas putridarboris TaxID=752605 RepID=A0ABU9J1X6_9GAMM